MPAHRHGSLPAPRIATETTEPFRPRPSREAGGHHAQRRALAAGGLLLFVLLALAPTARALAIPRLAGRVNDLAGMLSAATASRLEATLAAFERDDSTQVVVLTIPSLEGESLEEYSIKVAQAWGLGHKGKDNGVLLLVSKKDRKVRIEVGYGLEGRLTDALSGRIIDHDIVPAFKAGNFDAGIEAGVTAIIQAVRGEYKAQPGSGQSSDDIEGAFIFLGIILVLFLSFLLAKRSLWWRLGILGLGVPLAGILLALSAGLVLAFSAGGVVMGLLAPYLFRSRRGGTGFTDGSGDAGGSGSGGSDSGFSGDGGSFGGGGSSGDW